MADPIYMITWYITKQNNFFYCLKKNLVNYSNLTVGWLIKSNVRNVAFIK